MITEEEYNELLEIQKNYPILTYQNEGYDKIDKSKFTKEDETAFNRVTEILKAKIKDFVEFNNFKYSKLNKEILLVRFQSYWSISFIGVNYKILKDLVE